MSDWYLENSWKCRSFQRNLVYKNVRGGKRVLDIGSGKGRTLQKLAEKRTFIVGVDIDRGLIKDARKMNKEVNYVLADARKLPVKDSVFDTAILENVIEHIKDQETVMSEVHRTLQSRGKVVISTPNKYIYRFLMYLKKIRDLEFDRTWLSNPVPEHVSELTSKSLKAILKIFDKISVVGINPYLKSNKPALGIELLAIGVKK